MKINFTEKEVLRHLSYRKIKVNPLRNIVLVISIFLTTLLFTSVFTITMSLDKSTRMSALRQVGGEADISFKYLTQEAEEKIASSGSKNIEEIGKSILLGLANNQALTERQCEIRYADKQFAKMSFDYPTEGRMPKGKNEIATDTIVLDLLGIPHTLGEKIKIQFTDMKGNLFEDSFVLCGFWEGDKIAPASQVWIPKKYVENYWMQGNKELDGLRMLSLKVDPKSDAKEVAQEILNKENLHGINFNVNGNYSEVTLQEKLKISLALGGICLFILLSGYFIISNIYQISIVKDINFYGSLKLIGATSSQIKQLILIQTVFVAIVGILLGVLVGYSIGYLLLPVMLSHSLGKESLTLSTSPLIFSGSILFTIFTIWVSSKKALKIASNISPINASKYIEGRGIKRRKRTHINIRTLSRINLFRNKKRVIMVVSSLVMSAVLFQSMYMIGNSFDLSKYLETKMLSDYKLADYSVSSYTKEYEANNTVNWDMLEQIKRIDNKVHINNIFFDVSMVQIDNTNTYNRVLHRSTVSKQEFKEEIEQFRDQKTIQAKIYGIGSEIIKKCDVFLGEFSEKKFETGNYVLAIGYDDDSDEEMLYTVGEEVEIMGSRYTVMGYIDLPDTVLGSISEELAPLTHGFVVSSSFFENGYLEPQIFQSFLDVSDNMNSQIQEILSRFKKSDPNLDVKSKQTYAEDFRNQVIAQTAFGYLLSAFVGLIGVMNYINTTATSIISRRREFILFESTGMTKRQLKNMILMENLYIVFLVSVASLILSLLLSHTVVRSVIETSWCSTYRFTVWPLIIILLCNLLISIIVPLVLIKNQNTESINCRIKNISDSY